MEMKKEKKRKKAKLTLLSTLGPVLTVITPILRANCRLTFASAKKYMSLDHTSTYYPILVVNIARKEKMIIALTELATQNVILALVLPVTRKIKFTVIVENKKTKFSATRNRKKSFHAGRLAKRY